jgi:transposase
MPAELVAEAPALLEDWPPRGYPTPSTQATSESQLATPAKPRFQAIDRHQPFFRVVDVEALIPEDHPARAIWAFLEKLDLSRFAEQVRAVEGTAGRSAYHPRLMVSLWIYAYSQGVGSGRELSRLCRFHPAYQWLTGAQSISDHSLNGFRVAHQAALQELFIQVVGVLSAEGLVKLERVMQDGTKIGACAASDSFRRRDRIEQHLREARQHLAEISQASEAELAQKREQAQQRAARERVQRLEAARQQFDQLAAEGKSEPEQRVSTSDPEARIMKQPNGGFGPSYNAQVTTDAASSAVLSAELTQAGNDCAQLMPALERLKCTFQQKPQQMVADGGYVTRSNVVATAAAQVQLIGPVSWSAAKAQQCYQRQGITADFHAQRFQYREAEDCLVCPGGRQLRFEGKTENEFAVNFKYRAEWRECAGCQLKSQCCPHNQKSGRSVQRSELHPELVAFQQQMATPEAQHIYRQRSAVAETPHLWWKAKFRLRQFHVRSLVKAGMELLWAALTFNIALLLRARRRQPVCA